MKKIIFILLILSIAITGSTQTSKVKLDQLIQITEKAEFKDLVKLVAALNYVMVDSTREDDSSLVYITKENKLHGNSLACRLDAKNIIKELTFNTFSQEDYRSWKEQLKKQGFVSSQLQKGKSSGIKETEDFIKGKLFVATLAWENESESVFYEFTFFKE